MSKKIPKVPREMQEINQEYQQQSFKAGVLQYQIKILGKELDLANNRLELVNNEAAARKELDSKKAATSEVKNG